MDRREIIIEVTEIFAPHQRGVAEKAIKLYIDLSRTESMSIEESTLAIIVDLQERNAKLQEELSLISTNARKPEGMASEG